MRYILIIAALFCSLPQISAQNNITYGAGISYTNGAPSFTPPARTSRAAVDTATGRWYHFNTPGGWQWIGNTVEEISGCAAPAYTPGKGDSRLVVNNCTKPQVYWYDGAVWKWINEGEVYTAGQGIRIESNSIILDSLYILRFRTGSNTDGAAGTMSWNTTEETVDLVTDQGAVTGHLMESVYYNTRNSTGTPIPISYVVMAAGTTGNTGRILIAPAIANGTVNSEYILGLAAQTIGNNSNGKVQHFGKVRGIQTDGANYGETWVDGDVLYCSAITPGYLTKVLPTAPNLKIPIAIVIHAHPSNGTLFVRPSHFPDLAQINDVQLSSLTNGQVLTYNSTLSRWENATPANQLQTLSTNGSAGNISISSGNTITLNVNDADASATNELQTLSTGTNTLTLSNGGGTVTVDTDPTNDVTGSGTSGQVSFWTGTQTQSGDNGLFWDNTNKALGIGTTSLSGFTLRLLKNSAGASDFSAFSVGGNILSGTNNATYNLTSASAASTANITSLRHYQAVQSTFSAGSIVSIQRGFEVSSTLSGANTNQAFVGLIPDATNNWNIFMAGTAKNYMAGNLSAGTTSSSARLHVVGSGTSSSTWTAQFHNSAGNNNALMIRDDGNVGIGTNAPTARLHVQSSTNNPIFRVNDNGIINFSVAVTNSGPLELYGRENIDRSITFRTNASSTMTSGDKSHVYILDGFIPTSGTATYKAFTVSPTINQTGGANGITRGIYVQPSITSAFDWRSIEWNNTTGWGIYGAGTAKSYFAGNVAIGTTSQGASAAFEVASTTQGILFPRMTTAQRDLIATPANGLVIYNTSTDKLQVRAGGAWVDLH